MLGPLLAMLTTPRCTGLKGEAVLERLKGEVVCSEQRLGVGPAVGHADHAAVLLGGLRGRVV